MFRGVCFSFANEFVKYNKIWFTKIDFLIGLSKFILLSWRYVDLR